jgi:2-keto-4-pentenoate hydratase
MQVKDIAQTLASARRQGRALASFPSSAPLTPDLADAVQREIIRVRNEAIGGWKIGMIRPDSRATFGRDRFLGPVFSSTIHDAAGTVPSITLIPGGSAAIEAEYVFVIGRDVGSDERFTADTVLDLVSGAHIGIEVLTSPVSDLLSHGPAALVADQGFNGGLVLGVAIADWRSLLDEISPVSIAKNGVTIANGDTSAIAGGLIAALHFAVSATAETERGLKAEDRLCLGALAGMHAVEAGTAIRADFGFLGSVAVRFTAPE